MSFHRDTIVIGASSGGIKTLQKLLAGLSPDLNAAILIVQHCSEFSGQLDRLLSRSTSLPVISVGQSQQVRRGNVYVAPPDVHLVLAGDEVMVTRGARENRARPSINVLFRTAAADRGSRVTGVLLTGLLDDGVSGLEAIKRCGGKVVVQDPDEADFPEMPRSAIDAVEVDHVLSIDAIATLLPELARELAPAVAIPEDVTIEARLCGLGGSNVPAVNAVGTHVALSCPDCGGPLWKVDKGKTDNGVYRCHTGHAFSARNLLGSQAEEIEHSLWAAVRALTERAATLNKLADNADARGSRATESFRERAAEALIHSEQARQFLLSLNMTRPEEFNRLDRNVAGKRNELL